MGYQLSIQFLTVEAAKQVYCQSSYDAEGELSDKFKLIINLPMNKNRAVFHKVSKLQLVKSRETSIEDTNPNCLKETASTTQIIQIARRCCPNGADKDCGLYGFSKPASSEGADKFVIPNGNTSGSN